MIELILDGMDEETPFQVLHEEVVRNNWKEVSDLLPLSFLASKDLGDGKSYIFKVGYRAYPLYASINTSVNTVTISRDQPDLTGYLDINASSEDDIVFSLLDYKNIVTKALFVITTSHWLWVPIFGASNYSMEVVGLTREEFEECVREVLAAYHEDK